MGLDKIVLEETKLKGLSKVMVTSDWHVPFVDEKAFKAHLAYVKRYKPNQYIIAGDIIDFYSLSTFDKNPERRDNVQEEIDGVNEYLDMLQQVLPKKCKVHYLEGNHETRLQKHLWRNPELSSLRDLRVEKQFELRKRKISFTPATHDYWKTDNGHKKVGDVIIMHGDNRLNGATCSKYSGYSANNTIRTMMNSVVQGHGHRLAMVYQKTPNGYLKGMEAGCLCQLSGTANWQQGFVTFDIYRGKSINHRTHQIDNGVLIVDGIKYVGK